MLDSLLECLCPGCGQFGFFGFSLDWFGTFAMVMGCSVMFFGCLCPGCGLGFLWVRKVKHVSCARVVGLNYLWLLCLVTLFVGLVLG